MRFLFSSPFHLLFVRSTLCVCGGGIHFHLKTKTLPPPPPIPPRYWCHNHIDRIFFPLFPFLTPNFFHICRLSYFFDVSNAGVITNKKTAFWHLSQTIFSFFFCRKKEATAGRNIIVSSAGVFLSPLFAGISSEQDARAWLGMQESLWGGSRSRDGRCTSVKFDASYIVCVFRHLE